MFVCNQILLIIEKQKISCKAGRAMSSCSDSFALPRTARFGLIKNAGIHAGIVSSPLYILYTPSSSSASKSVQGVSLLALVKITRSKMISNILQPKSTEFLRVLPETPLHQFRQRTASSLILPARVNKFSRKCFRKCSAKLLVRGEFEASLYLLTLGVIRK